MFKFLKKIICICSFNLLISVSPTSWAALISYDFNGSVDSGLYSGETYNGSFAFDSAGVPGTGALSVNLTSFTFNFLATAYDLSHADLTPTADFLDGIFLGLNYQVSSLDPSFTFVPASGTGLPDDKPYFAYQTVSGDSGFGSLTNTQTSPPTASVPLPGLALWLLGACLGVVSIVGRRHKIS